MQHDAVLFNAEQNRFCVLNATSAFIWQKLEAPVSVDHLASELVAAFAEVSEDRARRDVVATLDQLMSFDLAIAVA